jgi:RNA polymerase sigma factor for flagellar operon FliA
MLMNANKQSRVKSTGQGDRERALVAELPLVYRIARQIHAALPRHVVLEDLVQAGVLGLIDAYAKYDDQKHVRFSSYAKFRIRGAILDSLRELDWGSRSLRQKARRIEAARAGLRSILQREPTESEMAEKLGMKLRELQVLYWELNQLTTTTIGLPVSDEENSGKDLIESIAAPLDQTPYFIQLRVEVAEQLTKLIAELPERQRKILGLYYQQELTMKEVGARLGLGESRISQLHTSALRELRTRLESVNSSV